MVQALEMVDDKDGGGMDFIFNEDEKPSYILVVQEDGQQNRQIHRYQDSEAMTEFVGIIADMVHPDQPYLYDQKVLDESTESSAF